jgi:4'-phosphopantetheinyl transferase EntD
MNDLAALVAATRMCFAEPVAVAACRVGAATPLFDAEAASLGRAIDARRAEFAAGRSAAREAMAMLGVSPRAVLMGTDRAPVWPVGLVGSISHSAGLAIAVCAPRLRFGGLGLDIEPDTPLDSDLIERVCLPPERDWIAQRSDPGLWAKRVFSAKEAAYKCQYSQSGALFDFETLSLDPPGEDMMLKARFTRPVPPFEQGRCLVGRMVPTAGLILSGFSLPA